MIANYDKKSAIGKFYAGGKGYVNAYNDTGGALTNGTKVLLTEKWVTGKGVFMAMVTTFATNATETNLIGIVANNPSGSIADGTIGQVLVEGSYGDVTAGYGVSTSGTVAANDVLEIINAGTTFIDSGSDGGAIQPPEGVCLAEELVTTDVWKVYLFGKRVQIKSA